MSKTDIFESEIKLLRFQKRDDQIKTIIIFSNPDRGQ